MHVCFDGCTVDNGLGPGVVALESVKKNWNLLVNDQVRPGQRSNPREIPVERHQVPLAPEKIRTVQTGQGMSMGALIAFLFKNSNMDLDAWWLHVYVCLNRVRHISSLLVYDLPPEASLSRVRRAGCMSLLRIFAHA